MLAKFVGFATKAMRVSDPSGLSSCFLYENRLQVVDLQPIFAERQGFEPWVPVRVQRFSRPSRSTAPASFLAVLCDCKVKKLFCARKIFVANLRYSAQMPERMVTDEGASVRVSGVSMAIGVPVGSPSGIGCESNALLNTMGEVM